MADIQEITKQIAKDICRENKICTCIEKDGHCISVMNIAERLAKQGYRPPRATKTKNKRKYYRKCGFCGERHEQGEMIRTDNSPNGWICFDCHNAEIPECEIFGQE